MVYTDHSGLTLGNNEKNSPGMCAPIFSPVVSPMPEGHNELKRRVDFLWLELTHKCNLQCIHCYGKCGPHRPLVQKMELDNWVRILLKTFDLGCRQVQFTGGEPMLVPYLDSLIANARSFGYEIIEVFSNGTMINDRLMRAFINFHVSLAFSIYSTQDAIHDAITRKRGSLKKTLNAMRWGIKCGLPVRAAIIAMECNLGEIERTESFLREMGVKTISLDHVRSIGRGISLSNEISPFREICGDCSQNKICVDSDGVVFPCVFAKSYPIGHVNQDIEKIIMVNNSIYSTDNSVSTEQIPEEGKWH
jgi:MoaA/NifB/PqqE/SkfB family radical SAM enzyme